jgi:hypothetical protein
MHMHSNNNNPRRSTKPWTQNPHTWNTKYNFSHANTNPSSLTKTTKYTHSNAAKRTNTNTNTNTDAEPPTREASLAGSCGVGGSGLLFLLVDLAWSSRGAIYPHNRIPTDPRARNTSGCGMTFRVVPSDILDCDHSADGDGRCKVGWRGRDLWEWVGHDGGVGVSRVGLGTVELEGVEHERWGEGIKHP